MKTCETHKTNTWLANPKETEYRSLKPQRK